MPWILFLLPVPANSQLNYGAELNENDARASFSSCGNGTYGLYDLKAAASGLVTVIVWISRDAYMRDV